MCLILDEPWDRTKTRTKIAPRHAPRMHQGTRTKKEHRYPPPSYPFGAIQQLQKKHLPTPHLHLQSSQVQSGKKDPRFPSTLHLLHQQSVSPVVCPHAQ